MYPPSRMVRRVGWLMFLVAACGCLVLFIWDLLPSARNTKDAWRALAARAVPSTATGVVAKREEHVSGPNGLSDSYDLFFVTLEHERDGRSADRGVVQGGSCELTRAGS
jgi:hypothetical protein